MYVPSNSRKYVCQTCRLKIARKDIETVTLRHLEKTADPTLRQLLVHWPNLFLTDQREILETQIARIEIDANYQITFVMLALAIPSKDESFDRRNFPFQLGALDCSAAASVPTHSVRWWVLKIYQKIRRLGKQNSVF